MAAQISYLFLGIYTIRRRCQSFICKLMVNISQPTRIYFIINCFHQFWYISYGIDWCLVGVHWSRESGWDWLPSSNTNVSAWHLKRLSSSVFPELGCVQRYGSWPANPHHPKAERLRNIPEKMVLYNKILKRDIEGLMMHWEWHSQCTFFTMTSHGRHVVSNLLSFECLFNSSYRPTSKKHQKSALQVLCEVIYRWAVNSPHKCPVTQKKLPLDDVIISWTTKQWKTLN